MLMTLREPLAHGVRPTRARLQRVQPAARETARVYVELVPYDLSERILRDARLQ